MKYPTIKELTELFVSLKRSVIDDWTSVTIGWSSESGEWSYQTGDNSFYGSAYLHPHWAVVDICKRSNSRETAKEVIDQLRELVA